MAESRYEKYIVRKPGRLVSGQEMVPERIAVEGLADTGPLIWCSRKLIDNCKVGVEAKSLDIMKRINLEQITISPTYPMLML